MMHLWMKRNGLLTNNMQLILLNVVREDGDSNACNNGTEKQAATLTVCLAGSSGENEPPV